MSVCVFIEVRWRRSNNGEGGLLIPPRHYSAVLGASMIHSVGWKPRGKYGSDHYRNKAVCVSVCRKVQIYSTLQHTWIQQTQC